MDKAQEQALVDAAFTAREQSYSPFSGFSVGAAVLMEGKVFGGCNIECSGMSATCCAERTAIFKAVSQGHRHLEAIAVVGGPTGQPIAALCAPCGVCRQVIAEFGDLDKTTVIMVTGRDSWETRTIGELLPFAFKGDKD